MKEFVFPDGYKNGEILKTVPFKEMYSFIFDGTFGDSVYSQYDLAKINDGHEFGKFLVEAVYETNFAGMSQELLSFINVLKKEEFIPAKVKGNQEGKVVYNVSTEEWQKLNSKTG